MSNNKFFAKRKICYWTKISGRDVPRPEIFLERVMGIEPTCSAWKADILPLNYTRIFQSILSRMLIYYITPFPYCQEFFENFSYDRQNLHKYIQNLLIRRICYFCRYVVKCNCEIKVIRRTKRRNRHNGDNQKPNL